MKHYLTLLFLFSLTCGPAQIIAQANPQVFSLEKCVAYALDNQPALRSLRLEDSLANLNNKILLAAWRPSLAIDGSLTYNIKQQVSIFPDFMNPEQTQEVTIGTPWTSVASLTARQLLYSPEVVRDQRLRADRVERARLTIEEEEIRVEAGVRNSFYRALEANERVAIATTDVERLERSLRNARLLFEEGIEDKVAYKRATIALQNAMLARDQGLLNLESRLAELKQIMGFPDNEALELGYDYSLFANRIAMDSLPQLEVRERVEIRQLQLERRIQDERLRYFRTAWLPSVSGTAAYNLNWQAQTFASLYNRSFPNSSAALNVSIPLFTGGRRFTQVELAKVEQSAIDLDLAAIRDQVEAEFTVASNDYLAARRAFLTARDNVALAQEVFDVVFLQYREGVSPFLEVVIAESDLQTTRLNALTNLINAMIARVELQRTVGYFNDN